MTPAGLPLHHVGIIQPSEKAAGAAMAMLGLVEEFRGYVPQFQALCIFTCGLGRSPIEFVIPDGGPLLKFNKGAGGLHHIALEVPDLAAAMRDFAERGHPMIESEPIRGAGNFICNFLGPAPTRGIITEFVQVLPVP